MSLQIRPMRLEDLEQVSAIDRAAFTLPWPERSFRFEITDNPAARCWVAESDGRIVGSLVLWMVVDEAHIATIATHPDHREQGIGRALLTHGLAAAAAQGATTAFLEVRAGNLAAQDLYRKLGFVETARRPGYYKDNGEEAVLMRLPELSGVAAYAEGSSE